MTCIISTARFVCADRRVDADGEASSMVKVARNAHLIAAAAGLATATQAVKAAVREGADSPEALIECIDPSSYAVVVTRAGKIFTISEGAVWPMRGPVVALGTGADLALGYLHGAGSYTERIARMAQRFVARRRTDCGGGCDVRSFE